jgi:hypothetical protein
MFRSRSLRCAGMAAVAGALAVPAVSSADTMVVAGPVKVRDYKLTLTATDGKADQLGISFLRADGRAMQMHQWSFTTGVSVTVARNLATARIKGSLGRYGKVDLKLGRAGALRRGTVPAGCKGRGGKSRAGRFAGRLTLAADTTYFKTVKVRKLKGMALTGGRLTCSSGSAGGGGGGSVGAGTYLTRSVQDAAGNTLMFTAQRTGSRVTQSAMRMDAATATAPASVMHYISAPAGSADFVPNSDLTGADLRGASKYLTGFAEFNGEAAGPMALGALTGDLTARFDSIGAQPLTGDDAMLMRR